MAMESALMHILQEILICQLSKIESKLVLLKMKIPLEQSHALILLPQVIGEFISLYDIIFVYGFQHCPMLKISFLSYLSVHTETDVIPFMILTQLWSSLKDFHLLLGT